MASGQGTLPSLDAALPAVVTIKLRDGAYRRTGVTRWRLTATRVVRLIDEGGSTLAEWLRRAVDGRRCAAAPKAATPPGRSAERSGAGRAGHERGRQREQLRQATGAPPGGAPLIP